MIKRVDPEPNSAGLLDPFEWNMLSLTYREKTKKEMLKTKKRKQCPPTELGNDAKIASSCLAEDVETTDPRNLPYEFVAVYGSLMSLMVCVFAWATRRISGQVQFCADNTYNCLKGVPNMYWFNTGIMDAKGIHFPVVQALTLGRAKPRNQVPLFPPTLFCIIM